MSKEMASILVFLLFLASSIGVMAEEGRFQDLNEPVVSDTIEIKAEEKQSKVVGSKNEQQLATELEFVDQKTVDPYENVVFLQRKYLPKKQRFDLGASFGILTDNPFFTAIVLYGNGAYSFTEKWAVELSYFSVASTDSVAAKSLFDNGGVISTFKSIPKNFLGANVRWTPFYGKVSFLNKNVIPVENFYSVGWGKTQFEGESGASTIHLGSGLSFAVEKWLSIRLAVDFYSYSTQASGSLIDTHINIGFTSHFPGADYR